MLKEEAYQKLAFWGQEHLLTYFDVLSEKERTNLLEDIKKINFDFFSKALIPEDDVLERPLYHSFQNYERVFKEEWKERGWSLLKKGKCALLVLAGGSGSRLKFQGPKGCFPITSVRKKTLFQCIAEKVMVLSKLASYPLEMAIMTSPSNHKETCLFFEENLYFGLQSTQVHFFCQKEWPLISLEGKLFLENPGKVAFGANGNGAAFKELFLSPIYPRWKEQNIEYINVIPIENPLADPFDVSLLGFHEQSQAELTIKATPRSHPQEKVGIIVEEGKVVEYGEGHLVNEEDALAYIGLFCINFAAISHLFEKYLPLHKAKKTAKVWKDGKESQILAWKCEQFLFDFFPYIKKVKVISYPRKLCFAPLKNFEGEDSIAVVQRQLQDADREAYFQVSGIRPSENAIFELAFDFYYPTRDLQKKWLGKKLPHNSYIVD